MLPCRVLTTAYAPRGNRRPIELMRSSRTSMLAKKSFRLDISRGATPSDRMERASLSREARFSEARWIGEKYEASAFMMFFRVERGFLHPNVQSTLSVPLQNANGSTTRPPKRWTAWVTRTIARSVLNIG